MSHVSRREPDSWRLWRRRYRDLTNPKLVLRRLAFIAEAVDHSILQRVRTTDFAPAPFTGSFEQARVVVAIAHWRYSDRDRPWNDDEILLACVRRLVAMPTASTDIVILTNDGQATEEVLASAVASGEQFFVGRTVDSGMWQETICRGSPSISVMQPSLSRPTRDGKYLTWAHKEIFRFALRVPAVTHFVYLEDDIGLTEDNLRYWMHARPALEPLGLIPGFLLFEHFRGKRYLIQQTAEGQRQTVEGSVDVPGIGSVALARADLPYHASYVLDRPLAVEHFARSAFRSQFRSRVAGWGITERAATGPLFGPSLTPLRNAFWLGSAPFVPPARSAVAVQLGEGGAAQVFEGALLEHLRPTYSTNPASASGKLLVEQF